MPDPNKQQPPDSIVFGQYDGLKNTVTQERLGPGDLASAINVDIDDAKQAHRRRGYALMGSGNYHSLFRADNGRCYVVKDNYLGILNPDYSFFPLQSDIGPEPLSYVSVGDDTYFSSSTNSGKITAGTTTETITTLVENTANAAHYGGDAGVTTISGHTVKFSGTFRAAGRSIFMMYGLDGTGFPVCQFDLSDGTIQLPITLCTPAISYAGNGWYDISITFVMTNTAIPQFIILLKTSYTGDIFSGGNYIGDNISGIEFKNLVWTDNGGPEQIVNLANASGDTTLQTEIHSQSYTVLPWGEVVDDGFWYSPVVNPTSNLPPIRGKQLAAPPMANAITYWNGRIYLAQEKVLWATELYLYNYIDKTKNYKYFEAPITVLGTVSDGLYVGTEEALWYLTGTFNELKRTHLGNIKCISGTMTEVSQELALPAARANPGIPEKVDDALLVMSTTGLLLLMSGGIVYNLTQDRMWFPDARSGTAMVRRQDGINQYVTCLDSGGTPAQNARFGDYLDATIIRGGLV